MKSVKGKKFLIWKRKIIFYYYDIINYFLIINYINSMNTFYLYKYYINKWDFFKRSIFWRHMMALFSLDLIYFLQVGFISMSSCCVVFQRACMSTSIFEDVGHKTTIIWPKCHYFNFIVLVPITGSWEWVPSSAFFDFIFSQFLAIIKSIWLKFIDTKLDPFLISQCQMNLDWNKSRNSWSSYQVRTFLRSYIGIISHITTI